MHISAFLCNCTNKGMFSCILIVPDSLRLKENVTLHLENEILSMREITVGKDEFFVDYDLVDAEKREITKDLYQPGYSTGVQIMRDVSVEDVQKMKLDLMPGFKTSWYYSGTGTKNVKPQAKYENKDVTKSFVRYICVLKQKLATSL